MIAHLPEQHQEIQHTPQCVMLQFLEGSLPWGLRQNAEMGVRYWNAKHRYHHTGCLYTLNIEIFSLEVTGSFRSADLESLYEMT